MRLLSGMDRSHVDQKMDVNGESLALPSENTTKSNSDQAPIEVTSLNIAIVLKEFSE